MTPTQPAISVLIVNWNGARYIERCLQCLEQQTFRDFEVVIVDNGSSDCSPDLIAEQFPQHRLLRQTENRGFAAANNLAASASRGTWLALLNNDAFPEPDWLYELYAASKRHAEFSGFGSCQLQALAPNMLDGAGDTYHVAGVSWRSGFNHPYGAPWDGDREIFSPCAAAAMYRRDAFEEVGGFDENFFCYIEDVDLAFRMQLRGHRFLYVASAIVQHVGSGTMGKTSEFARYHGHRNLVWCYLKNMPNPLLWKYLPAHLTMNIASLVLFSLKGEGRLLWRAKWDALKGLPGVLQQRRYLQRTRKVATSDLEGRMVRGLRALVSRGKGAV